MRQLINADYDVRSVDKPWVCVTGAAGFVGSYLVTELLARGYPVRAVVRDASNLQKVGHLLRVAAQLGGKLELRSAELLVAGSFDEPVRGCAHVYHAAAPVQLSMNGSQMIEMAQSGTKNVLSSIEKSESVEAVGFTSSIVAVVSTRRRDNHVYSEDDWNEDATADINPYDVSKVRAERELWQFVERTRKQRALNLIVVNPVNCVGPIMSRAHAQTSLALVADILNGRFPGAPPLSMPMVDVRDVARALVNGVERRAVGRFILYERTMMLREVALLLKGHFPGYPIKTFPLPKAAVYLGALFDRRVSLKYLSNHLGRIDRINGSKAREQLGLRLDSVENALIETCRSIIETFE